MDDQPVQEAEVVSSDNQASQLESLEAIISRKLGQLEELKKKTNNLREQLKSFIDNDQGLAQVEEEAKAAIEKIAARKTQIVNLPEIKTLKADIKQTQEEVKELNESLSSHLLSLYQLTGIKEFQTLAGDTREFELVAKLKAKKIDK